MAPAIRSLVLSTLTTTFCAEAVRERAHLEGAVQRQGNVDAYEMLMVVVLALVVRGPTAIAQLGHTFSEVTGVRLARSSFWARFNGALMLFDRAYVSPSLWRRVQSVGGYFLTRVPAGWNQTIVAENRRHRGRARSLTGLTLKEAFANLERTVVDVQVDFECRVRGYKGVSMRKVTEHFRLVAIRNPKTGEYAMYATNAPPSLLAAADIQQVYRLRWEVETFFKTVKSGSAANEFPSSKAHIVEALLYAGLLRAALAMRAKARQTWSMVRRINHRQWLSWWNRHLSMALTELVGALEPPDSIDFILDMLTDPNRSRPPTRFVLSEATE